MRESCESGSEGGVARECHPYPYQDPSAQAESVMPEQ